MPRRSPRPSVKTGLDCSGCGSVALGAPVVDINPDNYDYDDFGVAWAFQPMKAETKFVTNFTGWKARASRAGKPVPLSVAVAAVGIV